MRIRLEGVPSRYHEDHIAANGMNSPSHYNLVHKFIPKLQAMKIPEDPKSTSGGLLCIFGSDTFVPGGWMCKKQTSVSHSSTIAELISLDAGLRMDEIPALDLRNLVIEVFHFQPNQTKKARDLGELH